MIDLEIVHRRDEFAALRDDWNRVLDQSASKTIFLRWEWMFHWWIAFGTSADDLYICIARQNGCVVGIAPLFIAKSPILGIRTISFLGSNIVGSDSLDIISDQQYGSEVASALLDFIINHHSAAWDVMRLESILRKSLTVDLLEKYRNHGNIMEKCQGTPCPFVELKIPWDAIFASFSPKLRSTISRNLKILRNQYKGRFVSIPEGSNVRDHWRRFVQLNFMRFKEKKLRSPFIYDDFNRFHEQVLSDLHKEGMATICFLEIDRQLVAGIYVFVYDNKYYFYQSGYDPDWGHLSPGSLLIHHCIKAAHDNGCEEFDFLRGTEKYKYRWTRNVHEHINVNIYRNNWRGRQRLALKKIKMNVKKVLFLAKTDPHR
jgi:CelD/BcsL family acetyltransferase involved in cellulose biosynthesis